MLVSNIDITLNFHVQNKYRIFKILQGSIQKEIALSQHYELGKLG